MNSIDEGRVADLLTQLHAQADVADSAFREALMNRFAASGLSLDDFAAELEAGDYREVAHDHADRFLAVSPAYGRFLYMCVRACRAKRIVEFGTSMGISTVYLAAGLRDNGGGRLIGSELEPAKLARARTHIEQAGLSDLIDIRAGDALETLRDVGGEVDMLLLDGAFSLYLPVLKLIEPRLRTGALVLAENAFDRSYLDYIRDPANGYLSQAVALDEGRGNEMAVVTR